MKVALCLSGQPRFLDKAYSSIYKNLIEPNDADVFAHAWYSKEMVGKAFRENSEWLNHSNNIIPNNIDQQILELYKPKAWLFEKQKKFYSPRFDIQKTLDKFAGHLTEEYFIDMMFCMWYSIFKANHLKNLYCYEFDKEYDFVIRCRYDAIIPRPLICSELDKDTLYVSHDRQQNNMVDDWFGVSSSKIMNIYSECFNFMETLYEIANKRDQLFCNEILLHDMLKLFNVKIEVLPNFKIEFYRPWTI